VPRTLSRFTRRDFLRVSAGSAAAALFAACTGSTGGPSAPTRSSGPSLIRPGDPMYDLVCGLPQKLTRRIANGYHPERSAELQILPKAPNFVGDGLPHVGPWDYVSRVPMFWYGPGFIKPLGVVHQHATSADISPTWARLLGVDFEAPSGEAITDVLVPASERPRTPRLLVTVVWDGAGRNVLDEWPKEWPNLRSLIPQGAWIDDAEVGSSPTSSAQIHATIGTGAYPKIHGLVGHSIRVDGQIVGPWSRGPELLLRPTLADTYAASEGRATAGMLGTVSIQLGMLGHGAAWGDNERPMVILRESPDATTLGDEGAVWTLAESLQQWYRFPTYTNDLPPLADYFDALERSDGSADGRWQGHVLDDPVIEGGFMTPARIPYQTRLVEEVLSREELGKNDVPDLFYLNYKLIDMVGHIFSMNSVEMRDSIRAQDEYLPVLIELLNREVGEGEWAMLVTADHGSTPNPQASGAFQISGTKLQMAIDETFAAGGTPVVEKVKQTEIFLNEGRLAKVNATVRDVADLVMTLTQADLGTDGVSIVSDPKANAFEASFPSDMLPSLDCADA
jgi:hypothetical protein